MLILKKEWQEEEYLSNCKLLNDQDRQTEKSNDRLSLYLEQRRFHVCSILLSNKMLNQMCQT